MTQLDLLSYPVTAGYRQTDTSREAAERTDAAGLRAKVLQEFRRRGAMTADECAASLRLSILTVRPRCTELKALGKLADSGTRRPNASGRNAIVWRVAA